MQLYFNRLDGSFSSKVRIGSFVVQMANSTNETFIIIQIPAGLQIFFSALFIFLSITATLGNALILFALCKVSSIHAPTKLLFRCLAVTDLCVGLTCAPLYAYVFLRDFLDADYIEELHYITDFFFDMLLAVSALTSAAISVDRLLALLLRLRYRHVVTSCRVRSIIACFWVIAILNASFCNAAEILFSDMTVRLAPDWEFFGLLVFAIVISTFSYTKIFFTIRHQKTQVHRAVQPKQLRQGENPLNIARYKKTVYSVAWIQFAMLACYGPYIIMTLIWWFRVIDDPTELLILQITDIFFICLLFLNSSLNPILYCWRIRDVKKEVINAFRECTCC